MINIMYPSPPPIDAKVDWRIMQETDADGSILFSIEWASILASQFFKIFPMKIERNWTPINKVASLQDALEIVSNWYKDSIPEIKNKTLVWENGKLKI